MNEQTIHFYRCAGEAVAFCYSGIPQRRFVQQPNSWMVLTGENCAWLNLAVLFGLENAETHLQNFHNQFLAHNIPAQFILAEEITPCLSRVLLQAGYEYRGVLPLMLWEKGKLPVAEKRVQVSLVNNPQELFITNDIQAQVNRLPLASLRRLIPQDIYQNHRSKLYLASLDNMPVATLWIYNSGAAGGIYNMATLAPWQGKGVGKNLLVHAMRDLLAEGVSQFYLFASQAGRKLYQRIGFEAVDVGSFWVTNDPKPR